MATKNVDEAVLLLLKKVAAKKAEIKAASKKPNWLTNLSFGYDPSSATNRMNIMTVADQAKIVDIYAFLLAKEDTIRRASSELGLDVETTYLNYPIADWKADLKTRAAQLSIDKKKKELEVLDERVNKLVSADQRREMELEALEAELADA